MNRYMCVDTEKFSLLVYLCSIARAASYAYSVSTSMVWFIFLSALLMYAVVAHTSREFPSTLTVRPTHTQ